MKTTRVKVECMECGKKFSCGPSSFPECPRCGSTDVEVRDAPTCPKPTPAPKPTEPAPLAAKMREQDLLTLKLAVLVLDIRARCCEEQSTALLRCPGCAHLTLLPVAFCEDVYGCPVCRETWHVSSNDDRTERN